MKEKFIVLLSSAIILSALGFMFAVSPKNEPLKIGYVNSATILNQLPDAQGAQRKLDALMKAWSDTVDQMSKEYQTKVDSYTKQSAMMTDQAKQQAQQDINALQQQILAYRQEKVGQGGELDQTRELLLKPIRDKVYGVIARVAKAEKMQFVLDKSDQAAVILYADPDYDLTYKVLDILTRQVVK
ncbi:MAG: OmpH family outer membrane protein [Bacteroidetes bacterium]|nr:OmpH family outer membrane protein [Bacteroidota bacterium]